MGGYGKLFCLFGIYIISHMLGDTAVHFIRSTGVNLWKIMWKQDNGSTSQDSHVVPRLKLSRHLQRSILSSLVLLHTVNSFLFET